MEDATLVQPSSTPLILRSLSTQTEFPLEGEMLVGREVECSITLNSGHISRYHSKISVSPNGIFVEDLESTNGTFVNGQKVKQRTRLNLGDEVRFHELAFRVVSPESGDADATLLNAQELQPLAREFTPGPTDTNPHLKAVTIEAPSQEQPSEQTPEPPQSEDSTKILSATDINRRVNRNQAAQKDVQAGSGARLVILTAPLRGKIYSLEEAGIGTEWKIGRDPTSDIFINDRTISAHHAKLSKVPNGYLFTASAAKNGVIVNGHSQTRLFLSHNDKLQLGRIELAFKNDKAVFEESIDENEIINAQLKRTRRLVIGALATLTVLAIAVVAASI